MYYNHPIHLGSVFRFLKNPEKSITGNNRIGTNADTDLASSSIDPISNPIALPAKPIKIYVNKKIKNLLAEFYNPIMK